MREERASNGDLPREEAPRLDWDAVATWLLGFSLVVYLGLKGGGFDPLVHDQVGIAVWWIVLAGVLVGALPRRRPEPLGWVALGLLGAFVAWTALSLGWTESLDKTSADLARVAGYLGVFALALLLRTSKGARRMVGAVGAGVAVVALVGLLSRLHPAWFDHADQTANVLGGVSRERLSYPLNYWNALAGLIAIGLPALLQMASSAKTVVVRGLAAASLPAMVLTIYLTISRGGIAAAAIGLAIFLAFTSDRLPKLLTMIPAGVGGAMLIAAAAHRDALQHGLLNATAAEQGDEVLRLTIVVCLFAAAIQVAGTLLAGRIERPSWTLLSRRESLIATGAGLLAVLVIALGLGAPGRASDAWNEFKTEGAGPGQGTARLSSFAGEDRYQYWKSAVREEETRPLSGTGSGTFEFWWARDGNGSVVRDTHSLYLQTLGELGIVGLTLLGAFLLTVLIGGGLRVVRAQPRARGQLAAALAGCAAFCASAAVDWMWQIPALPVAFLLLASVVLTAGKRQRARGSQSLQLPLRLGFAGLAIAAIVAVAIPLASTSLVRRSQAAVRAGEAGDALRLARSAENSQPGAAAPRLQEALVLEAARELAPAAGAAREATDRGSTDWRNWMVLSRIEAERGRVAEAIRAYRRAASLDNHSLIFPH